MITKLIEQGWQSYCNKVASGLLSPENEKMMQLQLAQIFQTLAPIYEYKTSESIKVLLEVPVTIHQNTNRIIDIVISHECSGTVSSYPIELKCFRLLSRNGGGKRGAQNIGMYDYWEDIENIEGYSKLPNYFEGFQLTLTDDPYYVKSKHTGSQVSVYSTNMFQKAVTGQLKHPIANRKGLINLRGSYNMELWDSIGDFYFIKQHALSA